MRLYVGNLQWAVTEDDLADLFAKVGQVDNVKVVREPETNRSRGFGFVTLADRQQGELAIKEMDNYELRGRPLRVSEARERQGARPRSNY